MYNYGIIPCLIVILSFIFSTISVIMYVNNVFLYEHTHATESLWKSKKTFLELVSTFYFYMSLLPGNSILIAKFPLKCFYMVSHLAPLRILVLQLKRELVCAVMHISSHNTWGNVTRGLRVDGGKPKKAQQAVAKINKSNTEKAKTKHLSVALASLKFIFSL